MTKVETRQNIIMVLMVLMFLTVAFMAFKMLNAQIYLLTGGDGLREISTETRSDARAVRQISGGAVPHGDAAPALGVSAAR